jgi:hypothetical protein
MIRARLTAVATAIMGALVSIPGVSAAPQQLTCVVTDGSAQSGTQNQSFVVAFDQDAKTLQAHVGNQNYNFDHVSISNVAIGGDVGSVSLGIDRSSLGMVWQQYGADMLSIQYGQCHAGSAPTTSH